jgi:8-oxo-dGTP pyrophosphatase MutT (NUDIX family)
MQPWVTTKSEYIIRDKWLTVRADSCETSNGFIIEPYYVFEYLDWVHVIAFNDKSHILITHQYRHAVGKICAEIPCGAIHPNEKAGEAAKRELLEETGCIAERFALFASLYPNPASHTNTIHCFLASNTVVTQKPNQEESEEIICEFLPVQSVLDLIDSGEFSQALHVASLMLALRKQDLI